jgi:glycosyltransferase involved in cell wall biosynthesis
MMSARENERWHIVLLTCRTVSTDFRWPLAQELQALGHHVHYIHLKRRPVVTDLSAAGAKREFTLIDFLTYMRAEFPARKPLLFINSTNLVFPILSHTLRALCGGLWVFDMHDDLLYGKRSLARIKAKAAQRILISGSDRMVHAAPTLGELFPFSTHLGNASTMTTIERPNADFKNILVLASIDERLDFEFLASVAHLNPDLSFHIYGQISGDDARIRSRVDALIETAGNVRYLGPYVNDDLPGILSRYAVTLAPYAIGTRLTYYIDPLRYYHCLNSGMEVISTAIPKARDLEDSLHIVREPAEVGSVLYRLANDRTYRRNSGSTASEHNWRNRANKLMTIAIDAAAAGGRA